MKSELTHIRELLYEFNRIFGNSDAEIRIFHAPGRVNIIGEHIDYNGGYVLPCAIDRGTFALIRKRGDKTIRFASTNFGNAAEVSLDNVVYNGSHDWANYSKGIVHYIQQDLISVKGFEKEMY